jgi:DNA-binding NtrC family response regulator
MSVLPGTAHELVEYFDSSPAPAYLVDDRRLLVYVNAACCQWLGLPAAALVRQRCAYRTPEEPAGAAAAAEALCPPPGCFSGHFEQATVAWRAADGTAKYRRARFLPLDDGQDESAPVLAIMDCQDCGPPELADLTDVARHDAQLHERLQQFRLQMTGRYRADRLIGVSPPLVKARAQIELAARAVAHVLIVGPAGVGKDHAAKAIHYGQQRAGTLVPLSCSMLDPNLLRSTLRAAWTRATAGDHATTLLLEDIEAMGADAQAELLQMLRSDLARLRIVATSSRSLGDLAASKDLSGALLCIVSTLSMELPPLRARPEDVPLLAQAFLEEANSGAVRQVGGFSTAALDALAAHCWPGNVDELAEEVRQMHERATGPEITVRDLSSRLQAAAGAAAHLPQASQTIVLEDFMAQVERELIGRALQRAKGNKSKAARLLGMTRPRLYRRLVQLGFEEDDAPGSPDDTS